MSEFREAFGPAACRYRLDIKMTFSFFYLSKVLKLLASLRKLIKSEQIICVVLVVNWYNCTLRYPDETFIIKI